MRGSDCGVASVQLCLHRMVAAHGARGQAVPAQLLLFDLLVLVRPLNRVERGRQGGRVYTHGRSLGPRATPSADGAA
jgi:hypothetical protein